MNTDHDLSALLPDPPPPRPARREAALAEALRRFDGQGDTVPSRPSAAPTPARPSWARPQIAALASAVLVVLVSVPIWWAERDRILPAAPEPAPTAARTSLDIAPAPVPDARQQPQPEARQLGEAEPLTPVAPATAPARAPTDSAEKTANFEQGTAPPAPPPAAPVPAPSRPAPALRAQPSAPAAQRARLAIAETAADEEDANIVVTGTRVERGDFEARAPIAAVTDAAPLDGEWNACTLHDPRSNPTVCRSSAQLAEGLTLAWQGDLDRAIRAFDRAIAAEPDLALAYLNRGLAYQAKGDLGRALADLNRAVARDRTGARGYYHRSLLHRARGDSARADADAERAVALDPDYETVLP